MAILNTLLSGFFSVTEGIKAPEGLWEWLIINVFGFISNYGWRIVVFIVLLKILLLPLDIFQRYKMRKNAKINKALEPQLEKLNRQYASDPRTLNAKKMELQKKAGFSYFSSCIPMILTLIIFISLWSGMRSISQYMIFRQYANWYDVYTSAIAEYETINPDFASQQQEYLDDIKEIEDVLEVLEAAEVRDEEQIASLRRDLQILYANLDSHLQEATDYAQDMVIKHNDEFADSFLWIKSIWQPDVTTATPIHKNKDAFISSIGDYGKLSKDKGNVGEKVLDDMLDNYDNVTYKLVNDPNNKQNGYFILVALAFLFSIGSQLIMRKLQKSSGQLDSNPAMNGGMMKMMMFIMPAIMAFFAMQYTAAFALYMVVNSAMTILISVGATLTLNVLDKVQLAHANDVVVSYGRPDPNATSHSSNSKKNNKKGQK